MNKLKVLYEDNHIIVVEKPSNVLSQSDITGDLDLLSIVKSYIKEKYHKPGNVYVGLIHRLDRPVSGVMVFARTSKAAKRLTKAMQEGKFQKRYLAVVSGILSEDNFIFKDYLDRDGDGNSIIVSKNRGKLSILSYQVLQRNILKRETLVEIFLKTGRHHQIRVQFASRGYPLCGDQRYGKMDKTPIALCAYRLQFPHPITKILLTFSISYPKGMYWEDFHF